MNILTVSENEWFLQWGFCLFLPRGFADAVLGTAYLSLLFLILVLEKLSSLNISPVWIRISYIIGILSACISRLPRRAAKYYTARYAHCLACCCFTRVKKILEQVSRTRFLTGFEFRALSFGATQQGRRNRVLETYSKLWIEKRIFSVKVWTDLWIIQCGLQHDSKQNTFNAF